MNRSQICSCMIPNPTRPWAYVTKGVLHHGVLQQMVVYLHHIQFLERIPLFKTPWCFYNKGCSTPWSFTTKGALQLHLHHGVIHHIQFIERIPLFKRNRRINGLKVQVF
uniref:Uncharacterized protein n=1 Tax=Cacopsylla melanoneura TaxID=428564 RepID=A0A8D8ZT70_9HEMI